MASADDLILVYERRLADFEARLAALRRSVSAARMRPRRPRRKAAAPPDIA